MLAKIHSGTVIGLESCLVEVEVDVASKGLPSTTIVGLASKAVDEARQRVRSAIKNSKAEYPSRRITINLAPADLIKQGPVYDIPIAIGILKASEQIEFDSSQTLFFGELSLDGSTRHTKGALPLVLLAKELGYKHVFLPYQNAREASVVRGISIFPVESLHELILHLTTGNTITPAPETKVIDLIQKTRSEFDFAHIKGQEHAKRALEVAAAGNHNIFLYGPPGGGKTMMARAFPGILPTLTEQEAIEVTKTYSIIGGIPTGQTIMSQRPFRAPHHTTSRIGLIGGGGKPAPGEISLAHRGVLFLDEFPEYPRSVLESLRQPLEDGIVTISRASGTMEYPARFILVAAANPCPCGNSGSKKKACRCMVSMIERYQKKISGPILDRIDIHVSIPEVEIEKLSTLDLGEASKIVQQRVAKARAIQTERYRQCSVVANAELSSKQISEMIVLDKEAKKLLIRAATKMNLSARSYNKLIKVSRTIADLAGSALVLTDHMAEAIQYRSQFGK